MKIRKAYRFRVYSSQEQVMQLSMTLGCCRLVYNLALEQRRLFSRKGRSLNYNTGANDLPALKQAFPFFANAPSQCLQQALRDLEGAFQRFFQKDAGYPKPRRKFVHESCRFPQGFTVERHRLKLPKFGWLKMAAHCKVKGRPTSVTLAREGDRWYASLACEFAMPNPHPREVSEVGVDFNVITGAVTSDEQILPMPRVTRDEMRQLAWLQKSLARKKKGSRNRLKARQALARFHAKLARRRRNAAHVISCQLAKKHTHIAFEDLRLKNMTASTRSTVENPGRNVAAKAGLNRSILDVAPGQIRSMTKYKTAWAGGVCVEVDARNTSRRCSECGGHPQDDASTAHLPHGRATRDRFVCPLCGYEAHADINAARNILARAAIAGRHHQRPPVERRWQPVEASAPSAPAKQEAKIKGSSGLPPSPRCLVLQGEEPHELPTPARGRSARICVSSKRSGAGEDLSGTTPPLLTGPSGYPLFRTEDSCPDGRQNARALHFSIPIHRHDSGNGLMPPSPLQRVWKRPIRRVVGTPHERASPIGTARTV